MDLGFPEERESEWLTNRYFPSKVGGRPAWLDLEHLPSKQELECEDCKLPRSFLCQIYAPFEDEFDFHRSIFMFICRTETCQKLNTAKHVLVLRSQLPLKNDFYSEEPPRESGEALPPLPAKCKVCAACGCSGPLTCSRCKHVNYCSPQHQRSHWPHHKKDCSTDPPKSARNDSVLLPDVVFPEWEIVIEPSDQDTEATSTAPPDDEAKNQERLREFEKLTAAGKTGNLAHVADSAFDAYAHSSDSVDDKHFGKFKQQISKEPEQIIRYKRNGAPLWIADTTETVSTQLEIPNCAQCGGPRQFEFQIMPQMLLLLKDDRVDWGVLSVYTCAKSCKPPSGVGYVPEYVIKQDVASKTAQTNAEQ